MSGDTPCTQFCTVPCPPALPDGRAMIAPSWEVICLTWAKGLKNFCVVILASWISFITWDSSRLFMKIYAIFSLIMLGHFCSGCVLQKYPATIGASGIVLDSQSHSPVRGASVSVPFWDGMARVVTTGADGLFVIPPTSRREWVSFFSGDFLPPASKLVVQRDGYIPVKTELEMRPNNFVEVILSPVAR